MGVFILLGPPGSGKGTQGRLLARSLGKGTVLLGMGELLREEMSKGTQIGNTLWSVIKEGGLVGCELTMEVLRKSWPSDVERDVILDGVPRNLEQIFALEKIFKEISKKIFLKKVFSFVVDPDVLVDRMMDRLCCQHCGVSCSSRVSVEDIVDGCLRPEGHEFSRRSDDFSDVIRHRLKIHEENSRDVLAYYRDMLVEIDGAQNVHDTHKGILTHCL